jgi:hypothetical protein
MEAFQDTEFYKQTKKKLLALTNNAWNRKIDWPGVESWLDNFNSSEQLAECEKLQMLHLLSQFMYFGEREIKELLRCIYRDKYKYNIVKKIRKANKNTLNRSVIDCMFNRELLKTRFLGVGNPSESGTHLLYYFRQENQLPKNIFINQDDVFETQHSIREERDGVTYLNKTEKLQNSQVNNYVFLDDMCGSGDQACTYLTKIVQDIKALNPTATVSYYVLFANQDGINKVKRDTDFDEVDCIFELDDSFVCFSENSRHFKSVKENIDKKFAESIAQKYGSSLLPEDALGYSNNQLLIGFNHNTPDNTLPIIWFDEDGMNWQPIFKRYNKKYGWGG